MKWFRCMERLSDERMTKRIYMSEVDGTRKRGKSSRW